MASMFRRYAVARAHVAINLLGKSRHRTSADLLLYSVKNGGGASHHQLCWRFVPSGLHFSTNIPCPDKSLLDYLKHEIDSVVKQHNDNNWEFSLHNIVEDIPEDFPFKIEDNAGEGVVRLTRKYKGETIEVEVNSMELGSCQNEYRFWKADEDKVNEDKDDEDCPTTPLVLAVRITKDVRPFLEFRVSATPDALNLEGLYCTNTKASEDLAYDSLDFGKLDENVPKTFHRSCNLREIPASAASYMYIGNLDENLQKAFHKYLYVRGITVGLTNFMCDYICKKNNREYRIWLTNVTNFLEA